MHNRLLS